MGQGQGEEDSLKEVAVTDQAALGSNPRFLIASSLSRVSGMLIS
jgi:hypothetical protein